MKYEPMLAKKFEGNIDKLKNKIFEEKLDGGRCLTEKGNGLGTVLWTRRKNHLNNQFPEIKKEVEKLKGKFVLDGEIVVYKNGRPHFPSYLKRNVDNPLKIRKRVKQFPAKYMVFDILQKDGERLTNLSLLERKKILKEVIKKSDHIEYVKHYEKPDTLLKRKNIEGVMIKQPDRCYAEGKRKRYWEKLKFNREGTFKVVDYEKHDRGILMITEEGYRVNCNGKQSRKGVELLKNKEEFEIEVTYLEKTKDGKLRFPSFKRYCE